MLVLSLVLHGVTLYLETGSRYISMCTILCWPYFAVLATVKQKLLLSVVVVILVLTFAKLCNSGIINVYGAVVTAGNGVIFFHPT